MMSKPLNYNVISVELCPVYSAVRCIRDTITAHIPYWKSLRVFGMSGSHSGTRQDGRSLQSHDTDSQDRSGSLHQSHDQSRDQSHGAVGGGDSGPDQLLDTLREV